MGLLLAPALALLLLIRDEMLPTKWEQKVHLTSMPSLSLWQWTTIAAILFVLFLLEGAFRLTQSAGLLETAAPVQRRTTMGRLDYEPEFTAAVQEYIEATQRITAASGSASPRLTEKALKMAAARDGKRKRALSHEVAAILDSVTTAITDNLLILAEKAIIMREAGTGIFRHHSLAPVRDAELGTVPVEQFRELKQALVTTRRQITGQRVAINDLAKSSIQLRKKDVSTVLNESTNRMRQSLRTYERSIKQIEKDLRRMEGVACRRLVLAWFRRLVPR